MTSKQLSAMPMTTLRESFFTKPAPFFYEWLSCYFLLFPQKNAKRHEYEIKIIIEYEGVSIYSYWAIRPDAEDKASSLLYNDEDNDSCNPLHFDMANRLPPKEGSFVVCVTESTRNLWYFELASFPYNIFQGEDFIVKVHALRQLLSFFFSFTLVASLTTFTNPASTSADTNSSIQIKDFTFLDDGFDNMSIAFAEPDAVKDGHFKLSLDLAQDVEIKAMWVRTTDKAGKVNYHGTWKTTKEGIGYLLGIFEDNKVINPEFKNTLGTFKKGKYTFDLYGTDNNGGVKEGEYYYIELITSEGSIISGLTPYVKVELDNGVKLLKFASVGMSKDKVGIDGFTTDKRKDLHLKVLLDIPEKTEITSLLLTTTDDQGKVDYQGRWRTNRLGVGWFLGLEQDGKPVTKSFKEPLGTFEGIVYFDMYVTDDLKHKEDEYFVLEITTPKGAIKSEPMKYDELEGLTATAKDGKVTIKHAERDTTVSLLQVIKGEITHYGTQETDGDGEAVYENLPSGTGYFAVNDEEFTFPFDVTALKEKTIFDDKSLKISFKNPKVNTTDLVVSGKLSDKKITSFEYSLGSQTKEFKPESDGKFTFTETINMAEVDTLILVAKDEKGKKHIIRKSLETDLVRDMTVRTSSESSNDLTIAGDWSGKAAKKVYAFVRNGDEYENLELDDIELDKKGFFFAVSSEAEPEDIIVVAVDSTGKYERLFASIK